MGGATTIATPIDILYAGVIGVYGKKLLEILVGRSDYKWLMIDASHYKVYPHAAGAKGGNQTIGRTKCGSISAQSCILP